MGGKKTGTRSGNVVLLKEVFREAEEGVRARIVESVPADAVDATTRMVGVGAVVFANLATQRDKDIDFDWDKVLSTEGDSGPYLQYSHARCASIARKAGEAIRGVEGVDLAKLGTDQEWAVAKRLLDFGDIVVRAGAACEPHVICHYLLELAGDFSRWYTAGNGDPALRVLCEDAPTRRARLALTAAVQAALREGLALLGMGAPDQM
jgi:arginyl-tRNA synthetase